VRFGPSEHTRYLSYVHSPARYLWSPDFDARGATGLLAGPRRLLREADVRMSRHVHSYAVNSREVQARVRRFWGRDSRVINPPVDVDYFTADPGPARRRSYLLGVGRWIAYKNFDLVIAIAGAAGLPLVIAGSGPEEAALRKAAEKVGVTVIFEVQPDRERLRELYRGAKALLFPVHEDFGIIPVEAMACGTPVVGLRRGGLLETVVEGETGFLLDSLDPADYAAALRDVDRLDSGRIATHAQSFSGQVFAARFREWADDEAA
jgi:glycosyltransferase involved in cell wall biosynthesis